MVFDVIIGIIVALLFVGAFVLVRTAMYGRATDVVEEDKELEVDAAVVAEHLSNAIRCQTVSQYDRSKIDVSKFKELHRRLEKMYPRVHATLQLQYVNELSQLYTWEGSKPELPGILLAAHQDVVPVDPESLKEWSHPPFDGQIDDGFVWGRGALDCKHQLIAILEATEHLLKQGFQPERTIYLAFGHDEEVGGHCGAKEIAAWLQEKGVSLEAVLDEGNTIISGVLPGVSLPVAMVANAEKGVMTLELCVESEPGHSSTPKKQTAIGILAQALTKVEAHPQPPSLNRIEPIMHSIGGAMPFKLQMVFANLWLFQSAAIRALEANPQTNAIIRTTTAITMINGGVRENLLPSSARARVNFRLLPGDTIASVCDSVRKAVGDKRVQINAVENSAWEASPISPVDGAAYQKLSSAIRQTFNGVPVAPSLMLGASDSRHYSDLTEQIYRFGPVMMEREDMARIHGINERLSIDAAGQMVQFFARLIKSWGME